LLELERSAILGYEAFYKLPAGSATIEQVRCTSCGIDGWHNFRKWLTVVAKDSDDDRKLFERQMAQENLLQKMGVVDEVLGKLGRQKQVRFADNIVESACTATSRALHIFEVSEPIGHGDQELLATEWEDIEFEVALDSGSQDHVCDEVDCPGYSTLASPGSSRGQCFVVGNGEKLPNQGERHLNMQPLDDAMVAMSSVFQIARVTRPLMSVGKMCDNGLSVHFDDKKAVVNDAQGQQVCMFERQPGGLYLGKFRLKAPSPGFTRQGK
jgi:hypothetical protein